MNSDSLTTYSDITKEFLSEIISEGLNRDAQVLDFQVSAGSSIGDNFTTIIYAVKVHILRNGSTETLNLILKKYPNSPMRQRIHERLNLFAKEVPFYLTIVPDMQKKYRSLGFEGKLKLPLPDVYYGSSDGLQSFLAMENLKLKGYRMLSSRETGLSLEHITLVLKEYARFHAAAHLLKLDGHVKERYSGILKELFSLDSNDMIKNVFKHGLERSIKVIEQHSSRAGAVGRLSKFNGQIMDTLVGHLNDYKEPYATLGHGDSWFNNMMFTYDKTPGREEVPLTAILLDWQLIRYGSPCFDLGYTIYTSIDSSIRKQHLKPLLRMYHQTFTETLVSLGLDPKPFTFEIFWEEWVHHRRYGFLLGVMLMIMMRSPTEQVVDFDAVSEDKLDDEDQFNATLSASDENITKKCIEEMVALFEEGLVDNII